jgi:hypothetical protein
MLAGLYGRPENGGAGAHCPFTAEFMVTETYWPLDDTSATVRQSVMYMVLSVVDGAYVVSSGAGVKGFDSCVTVLVLVR